MPKPHAVARVPGAAAGSTEIVERPARYDGAAEPALTAIDIRQVLAALRRHLRLVLAVTAMTVGFTAYWLSKQRPLYNAHVVVQLSDTRRALTGGLDENKAEIQTERTTDLVLSQIQVLMSRAVAAAAVDTGDGSRLRVEARGFPQNYLENVRVLPTRAADSSKRAPAMPVAAPTAAPQVADSDADTLRLRFAQNGLTAVGRRGVTRTAAYGTPIEINALTFTVTALPNTQTGTLIVHSRDGAVAMLSHNLKAKAREHTDVIDVDYIADDPHLAQAVVNAVARVFQSINAETVQRQSRLRRIFVEDQLRRNDTLMAEAQAALNAFRRPEQVRAEEKPPPERVDLSTLITRREELDADRRVYQSLLEGLKSHRGGTDDDGLRTLVSSSGILPNPVLGQLYAQLVRYETSRDSLTIGKWGAAATHPDVVRLDRLIAATNEKLVAGVRSYLVSLAAQIAVLDSIKARHATVAAPATPAPNAEEVRLVQQVETLHKLGDQLRQEYQRARIAEAADVGQVEILDFASLPTEPIGMGRIKKLLLGGCLGLLLGCAAALALDGLERSLKSCLRRHRDVEEVLQIPALGVIPQWAMGDSGRRWLPLPRLKRRRTVGPDAPRGRAALIAVSDPRCAGSEAFRALRTNLTFSQAVHRLRTLVVTSACPGEGKTAVSANLAAIFAHQGLRVLLIDCDLRRPRLHTVFGMPREPGLTQLLLGRAAMGEAVRSTEVPGLWVLPAGKLPPNPAELLGGEPTRRLMDEFANDFELVVLDSPPVLAATDAAVLAAEADGVLLVVRAGRTQHEEAQDALARLVAVGARLVGGLLNDPDNKVSRLEGNYRYESYGVGSQTA